MYTSKVYLRYNSSILEAHLRHRKYTWSLLQVYLIHWITEEGYTSSPCSSLCHFDKKKYIWSTFCEINQCFNVSSKCTSDILKVYFKYFLEVYVNYTSSILQSHIQIENGSIQMLLAPKKMSPKMKKKKRKLLLPDKFLQ